jgi:hypothetical protein
MTHEHSWQHRCRRAGTVALALGIACLAGCMMAPRPVREDGPVGVASAPYTSAAPERECSKFACEE